jgi:anaerobic magnesium-protoporphyrin IX monomethyl ester cyclase
MGKRVIIVGKLERIEPLGILHLLGIARDSGWERRVVLIENFDYEPLFEEVASFRPDRVDFSVWTGWHVQTFAACDRIRAMGIPVSIGGPHATYSTHQCIEHADVVVKGDGFRNYRLLLAGKDLVGKDPALPNVFFDPLRMAEGFPRPDRALVYESYPYFAESPIKSIMCTEGCPFKCSYCYAPAFNRLYGGFELNLRTVDDVIAEAREIQERWGAALIYFQDDIFGFRIEWLREFTKRWREEIGIPWHCQIRLELADKASGDERLALFREGGCTGITLAVESGNSFLRQFVLERPMSNDLIVEGVRKIQSHGLALRLEQILAIPYSDIGTDLGTLALNSDVNPEMAWTSILAPYEGTAMGTIAKNSGCYSGNNDDLAETFFSRSVLRHIESGIAAVEPHIGRFMRNSLDNPLPRMYARPTGELTADLYHRSSGGSGGIAAPELACGIRYLDPDANARYCDQTVALQRIFMWLSRVPHGERLGARFVALPKEQWTWPTLGRLAAEHLEQEGYRTPMIGWVHQLAAGLGVYVEELPPGIGENPHYFAFLPSGTEFARSLVQRGVLAIADPAAQFGELGRMTRHWLFERSLYKVLRATPPVAHVACRHQRA